MNYLRIFEPTVFNFVVSRSNVNLIFRFWGDEDCDRVSVTSRKMITYTRVDCVGASKGLFFGLLVLVSALICLILFFVLIDHGELHVSQLAVFLADISHASIMILSVLAILLGFCRWVSCVIYHFLSISPNSYYLSFIIYMCIFSFFRIRQIKFHGEDDSLLRGALK